MVYCLLFVVYPSLCCSKATLAVVGGNWKCGKGCRSRGRVGVFSWLTEGSRLE